MTYDQWKTTDPRDYEPEEAVGECDCCGSDAPLTRLWAYGIETFACDECTSPAYPPRRRDSSDVIAVSTDDELKF